MRLLFVHHTVSPATHALQLAALDGIRLAGVDVTVRPALTASASEALEADGYLLGGTVNLGYICGALKHFFDTVYYPCIGPTSGRPYAAYLHGNGDATGALRAIESIAGAGLGWKAVQPPLVITDSGGAAAVTEMAAALGAWLTL